MPGKLWRISLTTRGHSRFARPLLDRPDHAERSIYDAAQARELLASTAEFPFSNRALLAILTEYRRALHDLAVRPAAAASVPAAANMRRRLSCGSDPGGLKVDPSVSASSGMRARGTRLP